MSKQANVDKFLVKVLLCGASGAGKTSLMRRFVDGKFSSAMCSTIGVDFALKMVEVRDKMVRLQIWDTAGQERFRSITSAYYRGARVIVVVYDVTNRQSFQTVPYWISEARRYCPKRAPIFVIVGTKSDLNSSRKVSKQEGEALSNRFSCHWLEASSKEGANVDRCFQEVADMALSEHESAELIAAHDGRAEGEQQLNAQNEGKDNDGIVGLTRQKLDSVCCSNLS